MKRHKLFLLAFSFFYSACFAQLSDAELDLLQKLDSIRQSHSIARHFAELYLETTVRAIRFFDGKSEATRNFIQKLETSFAGYFFRAVESYRKDTVISLVWKNYFADSSLTPFQYYLIGINAHINGDIWQALVSSFSWEEISANKKSYFVFHKALLKQYESFYANSFNNNKVVRKMHATTAGMDKWYGRILLRRWRKRQVTMARLYFNDKTAFEKAQVRLRLRMERLDRMILRHL